MFGANIPLSPHCLKSGDLGQVFVKLSICLGCLNSDLRGCLMLILCCDPYVANLILDCSLVNSGLSPSRLNVVEFMYKGSP